jgi:hypothetical protein
MARLKLYLCPEHSRFLWYVMLCEAKCKFRQGLNNKQTMAKHRLVHIQKKYVDYEACKSCVYALEKRDLAHEERNRRRAFDRVPPKSCQIGKLSPRQPVIASSKFRTLWSVITFDAEVDVFANLGWVRL